MDARAALAAALVVASCAPAATPSPSPIRAEAATASVEIVVTGLEAPWALAFAPDGRIFVTERPGRVRVVKGGALQAAPWATLRVATGGEDGLLGIALDPDFARNGLVYLAYTYAAPGGRLQNKLVRMRDDGGRGVDETVLVDGGAGNVVHDGGRVKVGPDGKLWWTVGDAGTDANAQDTRTLNGKVLRVERDGSVPTDNPFPGSYVWSYGHRNAQGLAWHPDTGALYETEHGPSGVAPFCCHDEVNLIEKGANYGWPTVIGTPHDARFKDPLLESGSVDTWAPSGAAFVSRGPFRGSLVFATLRGTHLHRVVFGADGRSVVVEQRLLAGTYGRLRDVVEGPDGLLYVLTSNRDGRGSPARDDDRLLRVTLR